MKVELLNHVQGLINHALATDQHSLDQLNELQGKRLGVVITDFSNSVFIQIMDSGIQFQTQMEEVDVSIQGKSMALFGLIAATDSQSSFPKDITLQGDIHFAQQVQQIARNLEIDWEELLSEWVGDIAAHQVSRFLLTGVRATRDIIDSISMNASEYARFEKELVPDQGLMDEYRLGVETLRDDVERLKQKIQRLQDIVDEKGKT